MFLRIISLFLSVTLLLLSKGVPAGTKIINIAYLEYQMGDTTYRTISNTLVDTVDQLLDMRLSCMEGESIRVIPGAKEVPFKFLLSNEGNGEDSFELNPLHDNASHFILSNTKIYLDNGNDLFDNKDQLVTNVTLESDQQQVLFLVTDIPSDVQDISQSGIEALSQIEMLRQRARDHNYSIVVATQSGANIDFCTYQTSSLNIKLLKSATPTENLKSGDIIKYSINIKVLGEGKVKNIIIEDNIPEGTQYISGSLKLNGIQKGTYSNNAIKIIIDEIIQTDESTPVNIVEFDVRIQ